MKTVSARLKKIKGFNLIELLTVVAIIAIMASIAMPAFRNYQLRTIIEQQVKFVMDIAYQANDIYQTDGTFEKPIYVNGININSHSTPILNYSHIYYISYYNPNYYGSTTAKGVNIYVSLTGLSSYGIPSYQDPKVFGTGATHSQFAVAIREINGVMQIKCGQFHGNNIDIQLQYLPAPCTCTDTYHWSLNTGTGNC